MLAYEQPNTCVFWETQHEPSEPGHGSDLSSETSDGQE